jgi:putative radical SAM enzyme (TIGR03279 family)
VGGIVREIDEGSIAAELGIVPGDEIVAIDGQPLEDLIDYRYLIAEEEIEVHVRGAAGDVVIEIEKDAEDDLGLTFESCIFTPVRECDNRCAFCFVDQAAPGMRATTRVHDDDYRLSFLCGNFVTLTNLTRGDVDRIIRLRLSPLYASIHATDERVRARLFRSRHHMAGLRNLRELCDAGIELHCQVVLCPGINDGDELLRTVSELAAMGEGILSVGVVPVGLTAHRQGLVELAPVGPEEARDALDRIRAMQGTYLPSRGTRFVFGADELYLRAERPFPPLEDYEELPQIENGVGLCRPFAEELHEALAGLPRRSLRRVTLVTGEAAGPWLASLLASLLGAERAGAASVLAVRNDYFGASVDVAGLLAGRDVARALTGVALGERVLIPGVALDDRGRFIDDVTLGQVLAGREADGVVAEGPEEIAEALV